MDTRWLNSLLDKLDISCLTYLTPLIGIKSFKELTPSLCKVQIMLIDKKCFAKIKTKSLFRQIHFGHEMKGLLNLTFDDRPFYTFTRPVKNFINFQLKKNHYGHANVDTFFVVFIKLCKNSKLHIIIF